MTVLYGFVLVLNTKWFIAEHFRYMGYDARDVGPEGLLVWIGLLVVLGTLNFRQWTRPSHFAFTFLLATVGIPIVSIPLFWGPLTDSRVLVVQLTTLSSFVAIRLCLAGDRSPMRGVVLPDIVFWLILLGFVGGGLAYLAWTLGVSPDFLSLSDVYSQREEFTSNVTSLGAYLVGWVGAGTLPLILATALHRRNRALAIAAITGILMLYSITGYKSYLVGVALTIAAYVLCSPKFREGYQWLMALGGTVVLASAVDYMTNGYAFSTLLVRRALATAGLNTSLYFDYFSDHPRFGLRHSVLSILGAPPYDLTPARLIGAEYYGSSTVAANANFIADGYANFGVAGCVGLAVVLGLYLRCFDKWSAHLPLQISAPSLTLILVAAANTAALTVLSTHGGIILTLVVLAMPVAVRRPTDRTQRRSGPASRRRSRSDRVAGTMTSRD